MREPVGYNAVASARANLPPEHYPAIWGNRRLAQDAEEVKANSKAEPPKPPT